MKTLLGTGFAGFIGSRFANLFKRNNPDWRIVIIDSCTYASDRTRLDPNVTDGFYAYDINDIRCRDIFREYQPDVIVHAAANSHVDNSINTPLEFIDSNVRGTAAMLENYRKCCPDSRFVYINSDEVYGSYSRFRDLAYGSKDSTEIMGYREGQPFEPSSPYSSSKAAAELVLDGYHRTYGLDNMVTLRCTNNYGIGQHKEKFIPKLISNALQDKPIPVYGNGSQMRDWLYVDDFCKAIEIISLWNHGNLLTPNAKYNISADSEKTNLEVVKDILTRLEKPDTLIKFVDDRPAHDQRYFIDSFLFRTSFGWAPETLWEEGVGKTIEYYKQRITN